MSYVPPHHYIDTIYEITIGRNLVEYVVISQYPVYIKNMSLFIGSFQADAPFGAVGEIGCQVAVGDCEVETASGKAGYLVGLEREHHAIRGQGGNWQHDLSRWVAVLIDTADETPNIGVPILVFLVSQGSHFQLAQNRPFSPRFEQVFPADALVMNTVVGQQLVGIVAMHSTAVLIGEHLIDRISIVEVTSPETDNRI